MNKLQWNFNRNSNISIQENALQNVVCEMASILMPSQCIEAGTKWTTFSRRHFQMHLLEWKCMIFFIKIHKFVPKWQINNVPSLVQIMAWRRSGDKPLSEPVMVSLDACMRHSASMSYGIFCFPGSVRIKLVPEPMLIKSSCTFWHDGQEQGRHRHKFASTTSIRLTDKICDGCLSSN